VRVRQGSRAEQGNVCLLQYTRGGTNCGSADALAGSVIEWWVEFKGCRRCVLVEGWPASNFGGSTEGRKARGAKLLPVFEPRTRKMWHPAFLRIIRNTTRPYSRPKTAHYRSRVIKTALLPEIHENDRLDLV
jgi:hypothetical protein